MKIRCLWYVVVLLLVSLSACRVSELTEQEKSKVENLKNEVNIIDKDIIDGENKLKELKNTPIGTVILSRIEQQKITKSILLQHISLIETGTQITYSPKGEYQPSSNLDDLESEKTSLINKIKEMEIKSKPYEGSPIGNLHKMNILIEELNLAMLNNRYISKKYNLASLFPENNDASRTTSINQNINKDNNQDQPSTQLNPEQIKADSDTGPFDFRRARWGMSKEDVKIRSKDGDIKYDDDKLLIYQVVIDTKKFDVVYIFSDNILVRAKYLLKEKYANDNTYVDECLNLKNDLTEKYGKPYKENTYNSDNLYKDFSERGMAYATERRATFAQWNNNGDIINILLNGKNYKLNCGIEYVGKKYEHTEKEKLKNDKLKNF